METLEFRHDYLLFSSGLTVGPIYGYKSGCDLTHRLQNVCGPLFRIAAIWVAIVPGYSVTGQINGIIR